MKNLIMGDEPLARKGVQLHLKKYPELRLADCFNTSFVKIFDNNAI